MVYPEIYAWRFLRIRRGERAWESTSGFQGQGKEEETVWRGKHLPTMSVYFTFDHSRLPLTLFFGSEPRSGGSFIILSELRTSAFPSK